MYNFIQMKAVALEKLLKYRILDPGKKAQSSGAPGQLAERLRKLASRLGGLL